MSTDQSEWPSYLQDDVMYRICDICKRKTWDPEAQLGARCEMPQPSGRVCYGHFGAAGYAPYTLLADALAKGTQAGSR